MSSRAPASPCRSAMRRPRLHARAVVLVLIAAAALVARLWHLGSAPDTLNTDELVAVHLIARILGGHAPGPLALDANGQPVLYAYLQAASVHVCGDTVWALRLPAALLGAASIPLFYLVARYVTRPWPAVGATALFSFSLYALSLARSGWINDFALPAELLAIWALFAATRRRQIPLLCLSALACAAAGYGYAPFRLLAIGMLPLLVSDIRAWPGRRLRPLLCWLGIYVLASLPLWASLLAQHAALAQYVAAHRINSQLQDYPPGTPALAIVAQQTWKVVVGLVVLVPSRIKVRMT